ncbi:hypothetical protein AB0L40_20665 [Patulibacter sp. NPDC049589]|uniref:hypothetical protein n=1 Tax=Patulibacter sp. NPDC049589 TaxID=3154731 RepID=UPI00341F8765
MPPGIAPVARTAPSTAEGGDASSTGAPARRETLETPIGSIRLPDGWTSVDGADPQLEDDFIWFAAAAGEIDDASLGRQAGIRAQINFVEAGRYEPGDHDAAIYVAGAPGSFRMDQGDLDARVDHGNQQLHIRVSGPADRAPSGKADAEQLRTILRRARWNAEGQWSDACERRSDADRRDRLACPPGFPPIAEGYRNRTSLRTPRSAPSGLCTTPPTPERTTA